jgi:hypothetical protein
MKYYIITLLSLFTAVGLTSCVSDGEDIGAPIEITADYDLSQGGASDADKARIKDLYDKYGSYFLYDVSYKDAMWKQVAGAANESAYKITMGNPANVGAYLDYLNDIWLKYFPDSFLKSGGIPYKVVMADTLSRVKDYGSSGIYYYPQQYLIVGNTIILPGMNSVSEMSDATKRTNKVAILTALWSYYRAQSVIGVPEEFFTNTDYTTPPTMSDTIQYGYRSYYYSDSDLDALRNRGFLPNYSQYGYSVYSEIFMRYSETSTSWSNSSTETIRNNDYNYYMAQIFNATDEQVAAYLKYPAIKRKWDTLINYYKDNYGIDLRKIATE